MSKNSNRVSVNNLSKEINKQLKEYKEDVEEDVAELSNKFIKKACSELKIISPKSIEKVQLKKYSDGSRRQQEPGSYAKSWSVKQKEKSNNRYSKVAYNKEYYRLTHLLEFGHINRDGTTRSKKQPHIRKTEDKYQEEFENELIQKIKR